MARYVCKVCDTPCKVNVGDGDTPDNCLYNSSKRPNWKPKIKEL